MVASGAMRATLVTVSLLVACKDPQASQSSADPRGSAAGAGTCTYSVKGEIDGDGQSDRDLLVLRSDPFVLMCAGLSADGPLKILFTADHGLAPGSYAMGPGATQIHETTAQHRVEKTFQLERGTFVLTKSDASGAAGTFDFTEASTANSMDKLHITGAFDVPTKQH